MTELLGYAASCAVLASFLMRTMRPLRLVAILSNVLFLTYGYIEHLQPIFLLHLTLLPINIWRLCIHWKDTWPQPQRAVIAPVARRSTAVPYAAWFAVGILLGLIGPLSLLLIGDRSEAARLMQQFQAVPSAAQSSFTGQPPTQKFYALHPNG